MGEMRNGSYGTGGERWMGMFGGRRIVAGFAAFLALMWVCTLVSKVVYTSKLPQVQAGEAEKKKIEHIVESDGMGWLWVWNGFGCGMGKQGVEEWRKWNG